jgi:hypothetical protein
MSKIISLMMAAAIGSLIVSTPTVTAAAAKDSVYDKKMRSASGETQQRNSAFTSSSATAGSKSALRAAKRSLFYLVCPPTRPNNLPEK